MPCPNRTQKWDQRFGWALWDYNDGNGLRNERVVRRA